ncbi:DMT family transporter [Pseudomonas sp. RP23018S]|uniref:DMT family transporter n=1 Tax=Pseudomonas sp. RP23018S TaxID=3096037 RepID=UPI002ACAFDEE|nr:DMT family transporter [Pseudomonas sp. RP23018S]MDZ5603798.1 DMT family transporter [Pseudomonas sp. RP23018S]
MLVTMLLVVVLGGAVLCAQSAVNGRLGHEVGVLESAWLTFVMGAMVSFLYAFLFESPHAMNLFSVPRWQVTGAFFGVVYMLVIVFAVPRVGTAAATVAVISGQLLMSLLIDNAGWFGNAVIQLDTSRMVAIGLLAVALVLIYKSNTAAKADQAVAH